MTTVINRINPTVAFVRSHDGGWFVCSEVADALGTSPTILRRMAHADPVNLGPVHVVAFGGINIRLYDLARVQRLHHHLMAQLSSGTPRRGRPRLWTDQERRDRRVALSAASYQRRRARVLRAKPDIAQAVAAERAADGVNADLGADQLARTRLVARAGHHDPSGDDE